MTASKTRLFGDDSALSVILATDDPREQKCIGRQVRHFDQELWQQQCENVVLQGNLAKFSQNEDKRRALLHTGRRRLAEASLHDNLWGIGLKGCSHHASSPGTWRGSNLLGQILEHVRETLDRKTMPQTPDPLPPDTASPVNLPSDTIFEVDSNTRTRLNTAPVAEDPHNAILSALIEAVPDDHAPEVLLTYASHTDKALIPEQGPDLISSVATIDDATFTTLPSLTSGTSATSPFRCRALLDTGSSQSFIHQGAFNQMLATGAADESYVRSTTPRSRSGFGFQELLSTNRQARITIQFYHNDTPSASLAVWMYIVPNKTMQCPLLLGRDSWMRFHTRSYQTLALTHNGRIFGELTLSHTFDNAPNSAAAYIRSCGAPGSAHHLVYDGPGMSLTTAPQLVPVNPVRLDGSPVLTDHHMVDIATTHDGQDPLEHFVASGRQTIPLTGHRDLKPGDILGTASHPLLRVPLETLAPHDTQHDVTTIAESPLPWRPPLPPQASRQMPLTILQPNSSIGSTMSNAIHSSASGIRYPLTFGRLTSHWTPPVGTQRYRRSRRNAHRIRGHFFLLQTRLWGVLPTIV